MELKWSVLVAVALAALCVVSNAMSIPHEDDLRSNDVQLEPSDKQDKDQGRRAFWLDTRDLEDDFKELIFLSIQELANEGRIDPRVVLTPAKAKRGRWQGFCFRRTRSGRFLPYICWKGEGNQDQE